MSKVASMEVQFRAIALYILVCLIFNTVAQGTRDQVNITMCSWRQLRANVIRDTAYLDGGNLYWVRQYTNGEKDSRVEESLAGTVFTLSFNSSFNTETANYTSLFGRIERGGGNMAPKYLDGVMFANNEVLYTYGGLVGDKVLTQSPPGNSIWGYEAYQYGAPKPQWQPGPRSTTTGDEITRYITHGAGVSAPSENLGFYFSGMHGKNFGEIKNSKKYQANETSNRLITVDLSEWRQPKFSNNSIEGATGRASGELVWLPVSESGMLVAIGGVTNPEVIFIGNTSANDDLWDENRKKDPGYMESVAIYDVAGGNWYTQNTTGTPPPPLAEFCSVVAIAEDKSSYNIYIYGGYDGINSSKPPSDAVYVLSIPSFKWIKVYDGEDGHGRHGHKCVKPYPDQMIVLGGNYQIGPHCLEGGVLQVFNLNKLEFQNTYDPEKWEEYRVPEVISKEIGGNEKGGATSKKPKEWADDDLGDLFGNEYKKPIKTWYPYEPAESTSAPGSPDDGNSDESRPAGGFPKWAGAVLGVVLGLAIITGLAVIWLILRRRRDKNNPRQSFGVPHDNEHRIIKWVRGISTYGEGMTVASTKLGIDEKATPGGMYSESGIGSVSSPQTTVRHSDIPTREAGGTAIHEMQAGPVTGIIELATPFNEPRAATGHQSDAPDHLSPVSPAVSPTPDNQDRIDEIQSATTSHTRQRSSVSSATGYPMSIDHTMVGDNADARISHLSHHRVSGFKEDFSSEGPSGQDDTDPSSKDPPTK